MDASVEQLLQVRDVGPIVAESIHTFFAQPHNREVVEQLRACGVHWEEGAAREQTRSEEHTSELQSQSNLVCRLLLEKKKTQYSHTHSTELRSVEPTRPA